VELGLDEGLRAGEDIAVKIVEQVEAGEQEQGDEGRAGDGRSLAGTVECLGQGQGLSLRESAWSLAVYRRGGAEVELV